MVANKYVARRWQRAREYTLSQVSRMGRGRYTIPSSYGGRYTVNVVFHNDRLVWAHCNCCDCGQEQWHGVDICKHVLAASLIEYLTYKLRVALRVFDPNTPLRNVLRAVQQDRQ